MTDIELIKSKLDIVEVISSYVSDVKRAGSNFKTNCPFHNEKSPSFMINPSLQIYKCFGCGKGGDVISFIQEFEKVDFPEALKISAEKAGVTLSNYEKSADMKRLDEDRKKIIKANNLTAKYYNYILKTHNTGKLGREYAIRRGIDGERIENFLIGYAPNSRTNLLNFLKNKGYSEKELVQWGLAVERENERTHKKEVIDKFRFRLIHPIFNLKGEVIGFSGRYIGTSKNAPKYLNSPETLVYKKNESLYGLYQSKESIRKEKFVIIEEGNIDILSSHRVGIKNIVAPLGTAFTINQAKILKRFCEEFYFCFDTDSAGVNALVKAVEICEEFDIPHKAIDVRPFKDPDELIMSEKDKWSVKIKEAKNSYEFLIEIISSEYDLTKAEEKVRFGNRIIPILKLIKNDITLNHYLKRVSALLEITEDSLLRKLKGRKVVEKIVEERELKEDIGMNVNIEKFFLSLLISKDSKQMYEFDESIFHSDNLKRIYRKLKERVEDDPASIYEDLTIEDRKFFEEIMLVDTSFVTDPKDEIKRIEKIIYEKWLKEEIMKLRREMVVENSEDKLKRLNELLIRLRQMAPKKKKI